MPWSCVICTDVFNANEKDVAAMPCGHTFHDECLLRWLGQHKTCPQCRKPLRGRQEPIHKLFFVQGTDSSFAEVNDPSALRHELSDLRNAMERVQREKSEAVSQAASSNNNVLALTVATEEASSRLKLERKNHGRTKKDLTFYKDEYSKGLKGQEDARLARAELARYKTLQQLVTDSEEDIQKVLGGVEADSRSREFATLATLLQRELKTARSDKKELYRKIDKLQRDNENHRRLGAERTDRLSVFEHRVESLNQDLEQVERDKDELKRKLHEARASVNVPLDTPNAAAGLRTSLPTSGLKRAFATPDTPALARKQMKHQKRPTGSDRMGIRGEPAVSWRNRNMESQIGLDSKDPKRAKAEAVEDGEAEPCVRLSGNRGSGQTHNRYAGGPSEATVFDPNKITRVTEFDDPSPASGKTLSANPKKVSKQASNASSTGHSRDSDKEADEMVWLDSDSSSLSLFDLSEDEEAARVEGAGDSVSSPVVKPHTSKIQRQPSLPSKTLLAKNAGMSLNRKNSSNVSESSSTVSETSGIVSKNSRLGSKTKPVPAGYHPLGTMNLFRNFSSSASISSRASKGTGGESKTFRKGYNGIGGHHTHISAPSRQAQRVADTDSSHRPLASFNIKGKKGSRSGQTSLFSSRIDSSTGLPRLPMKFQGP